MHACTHLHIHTHTDNPHAHTALCCTLTCTIQASSPFRFVLVFGDGVKRLNANTRHFLTPPLSPWASIHAGTQADGSLELVASFPLFGNVVSMGVARLAGNERDSLIVAFPNALVSVIDYDPKRRDIKTKSLHYFEGPEFAESYTGA